MGTETLTIEIFKDVYDGKYKIDWRPESTVRDRRTLGFSTLKEARQSVEDRSFEMARDFETKYIGEF